MIWERCVLALPSITLALAENQIDASKAMDAMGITTFINAKETCFSHKLNDAVASLLSSKSLRMQYAQRSANLLDGNGACRVIKQIEALFRAF